MAIVNQPTPLSNELAWNGDKNPIPDTNDGSKGLFSIEYGFPYVTQQPLAQGGIPPQRNDFNGVLNLLSKFIRYFQNGGVFAYSENMDYSVGMLVRSGDRLYVCKAENGANTSAGVQNISNSNYWNEITLEDTLSDTLVNQLKTVLVTEAKTAANTADWNTLTESRTYKISGATFAADKHQPVGAIGTGELVVLKNGDDTIAQVYYANSVAYDKAGAYHRINIGGTWTDWVYNITNKGGSVTGNFDINGKLTVDSLDIKNNFTVAGGTPVTGDDLQKVQDQIIAPNQLIYISPNGSDETGDGSSGKPYKTADYAITKINKQIPTIDIYLDCRGKKSNEFNMKVIDLFRQTQIKQLNIRAWVDNQDNNTFANLIVDYGKAQCTDDWSSTGDPVRYFWGNLLVNTTTFGQNNNVTVYLNRINITLGARKKSDNEAKFLFVCDELIMEGCSVNIDDYSLWKPTEGNGKEANINFQKDTTNVFKYMAIKDTKSASSDPNIGGDITNLRSDSRNFTISFLTGSRIPETVINNNGGVSPEIPTNSILYKYLTKP